MNGVPQLRTRRTLLDSWVWLGATEGGITLHVLYALTACQPRFMNLPVA
jgi:hypothetical protein